MRVRVMIVALALLATGCGGKRNEMAVAGSECTAGEGRVTIATGNTGGVYYTLGGGLAKLISDNTKLKATAAETGASVQNIQQLVSGDYDIAFALADTAADAVAGKGAFEGKPANVKALARIYPNATQVVARVASGIKSVADMRGKTVSTGSPKSGTEVIARRLLQTAGLDPDKDVSAQRLALRPTVDGMKAGQVDALVWSGGLPTPELSDLFTSMRGEVAFLDITPQLDALHKINPVYDSGSIPAATYETATDMKTVVVPNLLLVRADFPAANACAITRLVLEHKDKLIKVHPAASGIDWAKADDTGPIPLHEGSRMAMAG